MYLNTHSSKHTCKAAHESVIREQFCMAAFREQLSIQGTTLHNIMNCSCETLLSAAAAAAGADAWLVATCYTLLLTS